MRLLHAAFLLSTLATTSATAIPETPSFINALMNFSNHATNKGDIRSKSRNLAKWLTSRDKPDLLPSDLSIFSRQTGVNFEQCISSLDCAGERQCVDLDLNPVPSFATCASGATLEGGGLCICLPEDVTDIYCTAEDDCDEGETCVGICVSEDVSEEFVSDSGSGLTLDLCREASDCKGSRECRDMDANTECNGGDCRCIAVVRCNTNANCSTGELCLDTGELGFQVSNGGQICVSRNAEPAVCIGADSLKHIAREDLVFEYDALAHVLCDMNGSCATPGHMVIYKGRALMMKSYCDMTECIRKVLRVNSPKYSRGLTVASQTEDLVFTAFAARFETRAEEGILSVAIRLGG